MYMLDTDICIYIIKRKPRSALNRLERLQPGQLAMSAITFAELMNGAKKSKQVDANVAKLNELGEMIQILPFDQKAAIYYGDVRSTLEKKGNIIGGNDQPFQGDKFHFFLIAKILAVETCGCLGSNLGFTFFFLGPRGCFRKADNFILADNCFNKATKVFNEILRKGAHSSGGMATCMPR